MILSIIISVGDTILPAPSVPPHTVVTTPRPHGTLTSRATCSPLATLLPPSETQSVAPRRMCAARSPIAGRPIVRMRCTLAMAVGENSHFVPGDVFSTAAFGEILVTTVSTLVQCVTRQRVTPALVVLSLCTHALAIHMVLTWPELRSISRNGTT